MNKHFAHRAAVSEMLELLPPEDRGSRAAPARLLRSFKTETLHLMAKIVRGYDMESMRFIVEAIREEIHYGANENSAARILYVAMVAPVSVASIGPEYRRRNTVRSYEDFQPQTHALLANPTADSYMQSVHASRGCLILHGMWGLLTTTHMETLAWYGENYRGILPLRVLIRERTARSVDDVQLLLDSASGGHAPVLVEGAL